jgi:hypothetical protein
MHERLNGMLLELCPSWIPNDMVILRSDPGCADQRSHTDYTWQDLKWQRQQQRQTKKLEKFKQEGRN